MSKKQSVDDKDNLMAKKTAYQPTPEEQAALDRVRIRSRRTQGRLKLSASKSEPEASTDHQDHATGIWLQMDALGISSVDEFSWFLTGLINALDTGKSPGEASLNGALGFVKAMQPRDDLEALLLAQMTATHSLMFTMARRLNNADNLLQQDSASNAYNKLGKTFAAQMQTLKQYRTGGTQQVIVRRVDVREGAQAILGTINALPGRGGANTETGDQSHALADARSTEMFRTLEAERETVPRTSSPRQDGM
jgi:hypothetical protein